MAWAAASVRWAAGRSNRSSSTACTTVPLWVAKEPGSSRRSTQRNLNSSGHCLKSFTREGDRALRLPPAGLGLKLGWVPELGLVLGAAGPGELAEAVAVLAAAPSCELSNAHPYLQN